MTERHTRLLTDLETLRELKRQSSIFDFECQGELPDRYTLLFRGKGFGREPGREMPSELVDLHRVDLRLPYAYPERPPDLRWQTPLFHPNVSYSGFINLSDIGLSWDSTCRLEAICERLWDVARLAFVDLDRCTNYTARAWLERDHGLTLPVDPRPLRDVEAGRASNVVRYQRRRSDVAELARVQPSTASEVTEPAVPPIRSSPAAEVFYIGEETPVPDLPRPTGDRRRGDDAQELFYIGEDDPGDDE